MSYYCVTVRIADKTIGGKTSAERRQQLIDNLIEKDRGHWDETTSFMLVESVLDTDSFAAKASKGLSKSDDLVFIFDPEDMSAVCFGDIRQFEILKSFFPRLKKYKGVS